MFCQFSNRDGFETVQKAGGGGDLQETLPCEQGGAPCCPLPVLGHMVEETLQLSRSLRKKVMSCSLGHNFKGALAL